MLSNLHYSSSRSKITSSNYLLINSTLYFALYFAYSYDFA